MSSGQINHESDNPKSLTILIYMLGIGAILWGSVILGYFFYESTRSMELNTKENTPIPIETQRLNTSQLEELNSLKWVNKSEEKVRIPISEAKKLVLKNYQNIR